MAIQAQPSPQEEQIIAHPGSVDEDLEEVRPDVGFWQESWVQNGLPIATSLLIHFGLILLGLLEPILPPGDSAGDSRQP